MVMAVVLVVSETLPHYLLAPRQFVMQVMKLLSWLLMMPQVDTMVMIRHSKI